MSALFGKNYSRVIALEQEYFSNQVQKQLG